MDISDFEKHNIRNFTAAEITGTGAALADVQTEIFIRMQLFRNDFNRIMVLLPNGITTGKHSAPEHPRGMAVDWAVRDNLPVNVGSVIALARKFYFSGIGVYHNGAAYSFHFHIGDRFEQWAGYKKHRETKWNYIPLIVDPKQYST